MRQNANRGILDAQLAQINDWDNAEGDFDFDDAFSDDAWAEAAGDNNQYTSPKVKKATSMPYVYTVTSTDTANVFVNMFGAEQNITQTNFGNPNSISFSYDLQGYYGGGVTGYAALLQRTIAQTFSIGRFRMECPGNQLQLSAPLNITDTDPTGKSVTYPAVNYSKLNQFITYAIETECDITIYGGTQLTYNHIAGGTSGLAVRWYFWAADVASLTRALEGKPAFKELKRPDTYLNQTIKFANPKMLAGK